MAQPTNIAPGVGLEPRRVISGFIQLNIIQEQLTMSDFAKCLTLERQGADLLKLNIEYEKIENLKFDDVKM
jgi:hypothetical protein